VNVLSVDPGEKVGVCLWSDGVELFRRIVHLEKLPLFLMEHTDTVLSTIVYEDYIGYAAQSHNGRQTGSRFVAAQAIGMLKMFAIPRNIELVRQPSGILRIAAMHSGTKIPAKGHIPDEVSAYLHGFYYLETQRLLVERKSW
jgi:hypothetical protein